MLTTAPVLRQSRWLRYLTLCLLYASQGLPLGLFQIAIPAWFASQGMSLAQIAGFIAIVFLPWSFKLIAGPIMDRFAFPSMGRRRPWVLVAQSGLVMSFIVLAVVAPDPQENYYMLAAIGFMANFFGSVQDVAVDGMAIDILDEDERAQANAYMFGGQVGGMSVAGAAGSALLLASGLAGASLVMALIITVIMLFPLMLRERPGERLLPWTEGEASPEALAAVNKSWRNIIVVLLKSLILPMSIVLMLAGTLQRMVSGILVSVNPVITVQTLGWSQTEFANWVSLAGIFAAVIGVLLGFMIDRVGAYRVLGGVIAFRLVLFIGAALCEPLWSNETFFRGLILASEISQQFVTISIIALFMRLCLDVVAATQFAVYMAAANLASSFGSASVVPLSNWLSYQEMFFFVAGLNILFLVLWRFVSLEQHTQDKERLAASLDA